MFINLIIFIISASSPHIDLGMSIEIVCLLLGEQVLLLIGWHPVAEAGHLPECAWLDVAPEPDHIQHNTERDSQQAEPDNVVRVEVATGQVAVVSTVVHTPIFRYGPGVAIG